MKLLLLDEEHVAALEHVLAFVAGVTPVVGEGREPEDEGLEDLVAEAEALQEELEQAPTLFEPCGVLAIDERPDTTPGSGPDDEVMEMTMVFRPSVPATFEKATDYMAVPECQRAVLHAGAQITAALEAVHGDAMRRT